MFSLKTSVVVLVNFHNLSKIWRDSEKQLRHALKKSINIKQGV